MENVNYDRKEAEAFVLKTFLKGDLLIPEADLKQLVSDCMKHDDEYMKESGFFSEDADAEEVTYDEEDAFNFILGGLSQNPRYKKWKGPMLEDLIDDYLEYNYDYMVSAGLVE